MSRLRKQGRLESRPSELKFEVFNASLSCLHLMSQRVRHKKYNCRHFTWVKCSDPHALYCTYYGYCQFLILYWRWDYYMYLYGYLHNLLDDSWCCRNYCWFAFALWSGCRLVSFQYFVIDHIGDHNSPEHHETTTHLLDKTFAWQRQDLCFH